MQGYPTAAAIHNLILLSNEARNKKSSFSINTISAIKLKPIKLSPITIIMEFNALQSALKNMTICGKSFPSSKTTSRISTNKSDFGL